MPVMEPFEIDDEDFEGNYEDGFDMNDSDPSPEPFPEPRRSWREKIGRTLRSKTIVSLLVAVGSTMLLLVLILVLNGSPNHGKGSQTSGDTNDAVKTPVYQDSVDVKKIEVDLAQSDANKPLLLSEQRNGAYMSFLPSYTFINVNNIEVATGDEGVYVTLVDGKYLIKKANNATFERPLFEQNECTYLGEKQFVQFVSVSPGLDRALVLSEKENVFRHSIIANYWILDLATKELEPLHKWPSGDVARVQYAVASPNLDYVAFVFDDDLWVRDVTHDAAVSVTQDSLMGFKNGIPDWIYEEEVLGEGGAIYWSPDGQKLVFLSFDDSQVEVYPLEYFKDWQYPRVEPLVYPKTGTANPRVLVNVYHVETGLIQPVSHDDTTLGEDFIVYDVAWMKDGQSFLIKETDRTSRQIDYRLYNLESTTSSVVRHVDTSSYGGWFYSGSARDRMFPVENGYIDKMVVGNHSRLVYFDSATAETGQVLGDDPNVEAMTGVIGYHEGDHMVYFLGTGGSAVQRFVYESPLTGGQLTSIDNSTELSNYDIEFSSSGQFANIHYQGPKLPWQKMVDIRRYMTDSEYRGEAPIDTDTANRLGEYAMPNRYYETFVMNDGVKLEAIEVRPRNFDASKKYPLLVSVYGGPGLQQLSSKFGYFFEDVVSSSLDAIVLFVDPRGTGGRDWSFQSFARDKIGYWEPRDITEATSQLISRGYINSNKTAIWGWSYGGFTTLKTMEYDSGRMFQYGMAVAPVTDWKLYDSIYTERYMGMPDDNPNYVKTAQILDVTRFKNVTRFLLMHGTGDDNVHIQNTMQLLNRLNVAEVENYDMRIFPDSNHNIAYGNAYVVVFDKLYSWLGDAFSCKWS